MMIVLILFGNTWNIKIYELYYIYIAIDETSDVGRFISITIINTLFENI